MTEKLLNRSFEFDKLIQSYEFENRQIVKLINDENQQIEALRTGIREKSESTDRLLRVLSQLDESTKQVHKQFKQNRDNCESLRKTGSLLVQHEEALEKKLQMLIAKTKEEQFERRKLLEHYQSIEADYRTKYQSFQLAKVLETQMQKLSVVEAGLNNLKNERAVLQKKISDMSGKSVLNFAELQKFIIEIAAIKLNTKKCAKRILILNEILKQRQHEEDKNCKYYLEKNNISKAQPEEKQTNAEEEKAEECSKTIRVTDKIEYESNIHHNSTKISEKVILEKAAPSMLAFQISNSETRGASVFNPPPTFEHLKEQSQVSYEPRRDTIFSGHRNLHLVKPLFVPYENLNSEPPTASQRQEFKHPESMLSIAIPSFKFATTTDLHLKSITRSPQPDTHSKKNNIPFYGYPRFTVSMPKSDTCIQQKQQEFSKMKPKHGGFLVSSESDVAPIIKSRPSSLAAEIKLPSFPIQEPSFLESAEQHCSNTLQSQQLTESQIPQSSEQSKQQKILHTSTLSQQQKSLLSPVQIEKQLPTVYTDFKESADDVSSPFNFQKHQEVVKEFWMSPGAPNFQQRPMFSVVPEKKNMEEDERSFGMQNEFFFHIFNQAQSNPETEPPSSQKSLAAKESNDYGSASHKPTNSSLNINFEFGNNYTEGTALPTFFSQSPLNDDDDDDAGFTFNFGDNETSSHTTKNPFSLF